MVLYSTAIIAFISLQLYDLLWKRRFDFGAGSLGQGWLVVDHHRWISATGSARSMPLGGLIGLQRYPLSRRLLLLMLKLAALCQDGDRLGGLESCADHGL